MLDVGRLRLLLAISEHGGPAGAARATGRPAGEVAAQLSELERELGLALTDGDLPTPAGRRLVEHAGRLLGQLEAAESDVAAVAQRAAGELRIGVGPAAGRALLPETLAVLRSTAPQLELRVRQLDAERVGALGAERLDVVVVGEFATAVPRRTEADVERRELLTEPLLLAVPARHRVTGASVRLAELAGEQWVAAAADSDALVALERAAATAGFEPRVVAYAGEDALALALVAAGLGIALVPASSVPQPVDGVRFLTVLDGGLRRTVTAAVRRSSVSDPGVRRLLDALGQAARRVAAAVSGVTAAQAPQAPQASIPPTTPALPPVAERPAPPAQAAEPRRRPDPLFDPLPPAGEQPSGPPAGAEPYRNGAEPYRNGVEPRNGAPDPLRHGEALRPPSYERSEDLRSPSYERGEDLRPPEPGPGPYRNGSGDPFRPGGPGPNPYRNGAPAGPEPDPFRSGGAEPAPNPYRNGSALPPPAYPPPAEPPAAERPTAQQPALGQPYRSADGDLPRRAEHRAEPPVDLPGPRHEQGPRTDPEPTYREASLFGERPAGRSGALPPPGIPGERPPLPRSGADAARVPPPATSLTSPDLGVRSLASPELPSRRAEGAPRTGATRAERPALSERPGLSERAGLSERPGQSGLPRRSRAAARGGDGAEGTLPPAPAGAADDVRLSIFEDLRSEWFTQRDDSAPTPSWQMAADDGWRAAARLAEPTTAGTTTAGLPRRRPQALIMPGAVGGAAPGDGPPPPNGAANRSPEDVRGRLSSYRDGVRRGRHAEQPHPGEE